MFPNKAFCAHSYTPPFTLLFRSSRPPAQGAYLERNRRVKGGEGRAGKGVVEEEGEGGGGGGGGGYLKNIIVNSMFFKKFTVNILFSSYKAMFYVP